MTPNRFGTDYTTPGDVLSIVEKDIELYVLFIADGFGMIVKLDDSMIYSDVYKIIPDTNVYNALYLASEFMNVICLDSYFRLAGLSIDWGTGCSYYRRFTYNDIYLESGFTVDTNTINQAVAYSISISTDDMRTNEYNMAAEPTTFISVDNTITSTYINQWGDISIWIQDDEYRVMTAKNFSLVIVATCSVYTNTTIGYTLKLADNSPLPNWLLFDASSTTISGTTPLITEETTYALV